VLVKDSANPSKEVEKKIQTGIENEDKAEVIDGLQEGEEVVVIK
jgi:hypothetical protein